MTELTKTELRPRVRVVQKDNANQISIETADGEPAWEEMLQLVGTRSHDFLKGLLYAAAELSVKDGKADEEAIACLLSVIEAIRPRDEIEAMLAMQMAAVHDASMNLARILKRSTTIAQMDSAERGFNRLARTYTAQMETLRKYRSGGQQNVTVKHVHVNDGGQAIVGSVSHGGGSDEEN